MGLKQELQDYEVKPVEGGWAAWGIAAGGLAVAICVALGLDATLTGAIGVFVTSTSRGIAIVLSKLWGWVERKLSVQAPRPPSEGGQSTVTILIVILLVLIFLVVAGWLTLPR